MNDIHTKDPLTYTNSKKELCKPREDAHEGYGNTPTIIFSNIFL